MTEICQDEVFILDHEGPVVSQGPSTGMPDLVVEPTAGYVSRYMRHKHNQRTFNIYCIKLVLVIEMRATA